MQSCGKLSEQVSVVCLDTPLALVVPGGSSVDWVWEVGQRENGTGPVARAVDPLASVETRRVFGGLGVGTGCPRMFEEKGKWNRRGSSGGRPLASVETPRVLVDRSSWTDHSEEVGGP
jgi:hypothetical protein